MVDFILELVDDFKFFLWELSCFIKESWGVLLFISIWGLSAIVRVIYFSQYINIGCNCK